MNIQVGAGTVLLPGFKNVDVRRNDGVDIVGDATELPTLDSGSIKVLFGNAVFEHFYFGRHIAALRRWKELLAPDGIIVMTGLPDFRVIAGLYLEGARGIVSERFDLFNVYRYTHGHPEHATRAASKDWQPNGSAPPRGWIPQLHKCLMDPGYVRDLIETTGLTGVIFNYAFPGEPHALNLGFIATRTPAVEPTLDGIRRALTRIPLIETVVALDTVALCAAGEPRGEMIIEAHKLDAMKPASIMQKLRYHVLRLMGRSH